MQLLRRKWFIKDIFGRKRVVEGPGVIGKTPTLAPGEKHEYISGCDFPEAYGQMRGYYTFVRHTDNHNFRVRIPAFSMVAPWHLN